ncbi:MAG: hypothetical protein ACM30E_00620, partial [Nitrososphaerales archaeon]
RAVYLSGPLYGWYPDLPARVRLVPWGPLVQLADPAQPPPAPPAMPSAPQRVSFGDVLDLEAATLPQAAIAPGATAPISLTWRSLAPVSAKMHISLRLRRDGRKVSQQDDRVVSPWFPSSQVDPGLDFWSEHNLRAPVGMPDGEYELVAVVYDLDGPELKPSTGESEVQLGSVRVGPEEGRPPPLSLAPTLGPCIRVEQERPLDLQATVGSLLDLELLFAKRCQPAAGTVLRFVLAGGGKTHPLPDATEQALEWRSGAHQREAMKVRIPADIAAGGYEIRVQAVDGNGRALPRQVGPVPLPSEETLGTLHVSSRPFETTVPPLAHVSGASFDNGIRLLGFDRTPDGAGATAPITVTLVWRADQPIGAGYNTFVHLLGPGGSIAAQRDAPPGELPTQAWLPGEVVSTTLTLQAAQPLTSGEYRLIAGLYDSATLQRSPVKLPDVSNALDYVDLGTLRLVQ